MPTYKCFEDLPVWNAAIDLAVRLFELTEHPSFRYKGDLVNQLRRASLSVSNNIAEGFERGSTNELIAFLYIARGSAGEVRSMLRFALRLTALGEARGDLETLASDAESISRQIRAWLDSLQNSDIDGQRHLNDKSRAIYQEDRRREAFMERMSLFKEQLDARTLFRATHGGPSAEEPVVETTLVPQTLKSEISDLKSQNPSPAAPSQISNHKSQIISPAAPPSQISNHKSQMSPPSCPLCSKPMRQRTPRTGTNAGNPFWGCTAYPACKGTRSFLV